jgi:hypothetical protein
VDRFQVFADWLETTHMRTLAKILVVVAAALPCAAQVAVSDVFNRPNSNNLGVEWTQRDGHAKIAGNQLQGNDPGFGWSGPDLPEQGRECRLVVHADVVHDPRGTDGVGRGDDVVLRRR